MGDSRRGAPSEGIRVVQQLDTYGRVPSGLLLDHDVSDAECRLYALLTTWDYRREGEVWPTQKTLGERLGWSDRTVRRVLAALAHRGAIEQRRSGPNPNTIVLLADVVDRSDLAGQPVDRSDGDTKTGQTVLVDRTPGENTPLTNERKNEKKNENEERVLRVFAFWQEHLDHPRAVLDAKRRRCIEWALKNYPARDVADAILGLSESPYHRGDNETGTKYDDITLVFRDATHLERFRDQHRCPPVARGKNGRAPQGALDEVARRDAEAAAARYR